MYLPQVAKPFSTYPRKQNISVPIPGSKTFLHLFQVVNLSVPIPGSNLSVPIPGSKTFLYLSQVANLSVPIMSNVQPIPSVIIYLKKKKEIALPSRAKPPRSDLSHVFKISKHHINTLYMVIVTFHF